LVKLIPIDNVGDAISPSLAARMICSADCCLEITAGGGEELLAFLEADFVTVEGLVQNTCNTGIGRSGSAF
jgi:hypothetical protein